MRAGKMFWLLGFGFLFIQIIVPGFGERFSKEVIRSWLEHMDSPQCNDKTLEMARNAPKALEEVLLWKDPKNHLGRWNGLGNWSQLASEKTISMDDYFDVTIHMLSKIDEFVFPDLLPEERRHLTDFITTFGNKPYKEIPVYIGVHSSVGFLIVCLKTLAKYNMIKKRDTIDEMMGQLSEIKDDLEKNRAKNNNVAIKKLQDFLVTVERRRDDFTTDSFEVINKFAKNILSQLEKPER